MLCPNCESSNREGAKFCDECGFPLTGAIAQRAAELHSSGMGGADEALDAGSAEHADDSASEPIEPSIPDITGESTDTSGTRAEASDPTARFENLDADEAIKETTAEAEDPSSPANPDVAVSTESDYTGLNQIEGDYGERLVDPGYVEPESSWRDGNTMQMPRIEGEDAPRSKDYLASATTKQHNGKKTAVIVVVVIALVAAIAAFSTYQMELWGGHAIPDVKGMTEADAAGTLEANGFSVRSTQVKSDDTEGLVLIMDPTAGSRANEGDEVVIHIATAREIPAVVGKSAGEAEELLEEAGYENVAFAGERSDEPEGTVLSISPEAGTRAKSSIAVMVKIAEPFTVPDTSSMGLDDTIAAIQGAGLRYDIAYIDTQEHPDGSVIGTDPVAGTKVKGDSVVLIEVARARGMQLTQLTRNMLSPGSTVTIDGVSYEIESVSSVEYVGDDIVAFTITGRPFTYFMGQYVSLESRSVSGNVVWTEDDGVSGIY